MYSSLGQFSKDLKLRDSVLTTCPVYTLKDKKEAPAWVSWIPVSLSSASFTDVNDSSIREYEIEFFVSTDWGGMFSRLASEESACSRQLFQSVGLVVQCHQLAMISVHHRLLRHHMNINTESGSIVETSCSDLRNCSSTFDVVSFLKMNVLYNDTDKLWDYFQKIM